MAILVAGTLDLLMKSKNTGKFALVDFKRTDPTPKYKNAPPNLLGVNGSNLAAWAKYPLSDLEDSDFGKYTTQLAVLSKILRDKYGIDVGENTFLLQVHEALDVAHLVRTVDISSAINCMFAIEKERWSAAAIVNVL